MKIPSSISNLLLLGFSLLFSFIVLEIILRHFLPVGAVIYQLDENCLHRLIPDSKKLYGRRKVEGGEKILFRVNHAGYRGDELVSPKTSPRIAFYGDSFIAAEFSREESSVPGQVERRLNELHTPRPRAINAGVVGYGPDQVHVRLMDELEKLDPDLTVVSIFAGNDYGDLLRNKMYRLDEHGSLVRNDYVLGDTLEASFKSVSPLVTWRLSRRLVELSLRRLRSRSRIQTQASRAPERTAESGQIDIWLEAASKDYESYVLDGDKVVVNLFNDYWDADIALLPSSPSAQYKVKLMRELLRDFREVFSSRQRRWLLLIIPAPVDVCVDYPLAPGLSRYPEYRRDRLSGQLSEIASDLGIPHLDIYEPFRSVDSCDLYFPYPNDHWNDRGQELAARLLVDFIRKEGLLKTPNLTALPSIKARSARSSSS